MSKLSLVVLLLLASAANAAPHEPQALEEAFTRVDASLAQGHQPVVVFDLDDTLIDTKERTFRILKEFLASPTIRAQFPEETAKLVGLRIEEVQFGMVDTFAGRGIHNTAFVDAANAYWKPRFFGNEFSFRDRPTLGAAEYANDLHLQGAKIVYLTGRDAPSMKAGTFGNLHNNHFPFSELDSSTVLLMKPDPKMDDLEFKKSALEQVGKMGEVVGIYENEPANLNALHAAFPNALSIFLDTIHSPRPDLPHEGAHWVKNFLR